MKMDGLHSLVMLIVLQSLDLVRMQVIFYSNSSDATGRRMHWAGLKIIPIYQISQYILLSPFKSSYTYSYPSVHQLVPLAYLASLAVANAPNIPNWLLTPAILCVLFLFFTRVIW